ncbi:MAG: zf-HC2 domain-containing protein [Gammaproteobacteria bacterium]|nr:zf-HC2 domain-containing protein [Gammaproteobacteria bacterium]
MLTCKQFDEFMMDYLEGNLPFWQKVSCGLHLRMCRKCAKFVDQYRRVVLLEKDALLPSADSIPEAVPEELVNAALAYRQQNLGGD